MSTERKTPVEQQTAESLLRWLESFPRQQIERRLAGLVSQRRDLDIEIRFLQNQLVRYREYLADLQPGHPDAAPRQSAVAQTGTVGARPDASPAYPPKRLAVTRLLAERPSYSWKLSEIRDALVERGWLEDSEKARHALQVVILKMAKSGEVGKPDTGIYTYRPRGSQQVTLPPTREESD